MKKTTYRTQLVMEYCDQFPNASTNAIARLLLRDYKIDFGNFDKARAIVRYVRNENKPSENRKNYERTEKEKKQFIKKNFQLPESDYKIIEPYNINSKRVLILSDIHIPYQDNKALDLAIGYGQRHNIDAIYLNGDIIDMYQGSRFIKDRRLRDLAGELELTREFLKTLKDTFNCKIYFKIGNHEARWENFLRLQAPELLGIPDFELSQVLKFKEFGVTEIKSTQMSYIGKLAVLHGHEFGHSIFSPVNPARGLYMRAKESSCVGHHHQTSEHTEKSLSGDVVTTWSIGALCGLSPEYMPFNKWNLGFAFVEVDDKGNYKFHNKRIINYEIV